MSSAVRYPFYLVATATVAVAVAGSAQTLQRRPLQKAEPPAKSANSTGKEAERAPMELILPKGTSMQVEVTRQYPMKDGESLEGHLLYPLYASGKLALPKDAVVHGKVIDLEPARKLRWNARLRGDFTPFHTATVRFNELVLAEGALPISAAAAADGAPVLQLTAAGAGAKRAFVRREIALAKSQLHDRIEWFISPGLGGRALQMLYHQLPYHPEEIAAHTAWSFELTAPLVLPATAMDSADPPLSAPAAGKPEMWTVNALLTSGLSSARAHPGDPVEALVVEPVYDRDKELVVPQGSTLVGRVTAAKAARSFGRNGKLRFTFQQVRFPQGFGAPVQGSLAGATAEKTQDLQMDAEGTVTPRKKSSAVAPMLLTMLAGRALDQDGGGMVLKQGVASNGFGLVGRLVGVAAGAPNLAAGIGFYAAGLSFYDNFLHTGSDVVFPKDTRIEIETTPLRSPVLKP
ncbi:MAG TPA: hypothetical protein VGR47_03560 [Terracidiphilus sp.]|nr:hypothetical protein [Terracidiphilus sp.]